MAGARCPHLATASAGHFRSHTRLLPPRYPLPSPYPLSSDAQVFHEIDFGGSGLLLLRIVLLTLWPRAPAPVAEAAKGEDADKGPQLFAPSLPTRETAAAAAKVAELLRSFSVELSAPGASPSPGWVKCVLCCGVWSER